MLTIIMALAKVNGKYLFGDTSGKLPWGRIKEDMDLFVDLNSKKGVYLCYESTYKTLPKSVIKRLKPVIAETLNREWVDNETNYVILGGRKLIDSALPWADHIIISEIGGIIEEKDSFVYLKDSTVAKLASAERETTCWYFSTPAFDPTKVHLKQAYCLTRDRYKTSK